MINLNRKKIVSFFNKNITTIAPLMALIVLVIFFSLVSGGFITVRNFFNVLSQTAITLILATAVTFALLLGEIDLSFANLATLTGILVALLMEAGLNPILAFIIALASGLVVGLTNGAVIALLGVPSFLATLAMMQITNGLAIYLTQSRPIFTVPKFLAYIGNGTIGPVPVISIIALGIALICQFVLTYTPFGRYIYMVGSNREAAKLAGVNVAKVTLYTFAIVGFIAGLGGLIGTGRLSTAQTGNFAQLLFGGLSATVIGGTALSGGKGGIINTIIGSFIWVVLSNGLTLMEISIYIKTFITGLVLLGALSFNIYLQRFAGGE